MTDQFFVGAFIGALLFFLILTGINKMSELASKSAQEAYVNSLYAMNTDQLIAEVMRVQMEAAKLIQEVTEERDAALAKLDEQGDAE